MSSLSKTRADTLLQLEILAERYPNLTVGVILSDALAGRELASVSDQDLCAALERIFVSYTQLEAAGFVRRGG